MDGALGMKQRHRDGGKLTGDRLPWQAQLQQHWFWIPTYVPFTINWWFDRCRLVARCKQMIQTGILVMLLMSGVETVLWFN